MNRGGSVSSVDKKAGFTIVETLIVLAVTSALLLSAMIAMSGRQARTEFQVGSRQLKQNLQAEINKISSGYYANQSDFSCSASGGSITINALGSNEQGTNGGCVLLGTVVAIGGAEANSYTTYAVAGAREKSGGVPPTSFASSGKTVVEQTKQTTMLPRGFSFVKAKLTKKDGGEINWAAGTEGVLTITHDLEQLGSDAASVQPLVLHGFDNFIAGPVSAVNSQAPLRVQRADLCFVGGTGQSVQVTIGGSGGTSLTSQIYGTENCT